MTEESKSPEKTPARRRSPKKTTSKAKLTPAPNHSPADPFLPLGATEANGVTTMSFAGLILGSVYLKTVTVKDGLQSEAVTLVGKGRIIPSGISGFYKVAT